MTIPITAPPTDFDAPRALLAWLGAHLVRLDAEAREFRELRRALIAEIADPAIYGCGSHVEVGESA